MDSLKDIGSGSVGQFGFHREPQASLPESLYQRAKENVAPDWQQIRQEGFGLDYPSLETLESSMPKNVQLSEIGQEGLEKALDLVTPLGVGTIIGPSARGFYKTIKDAQAAGVSPMQTQEMAETLIASGEPARLVTQKTGYYQDRFGNWKSQIDDIGTGPTKAVGPLFKQWKPSQKLNEDGRWPERQLEKVFHHPRLFEEYPWMKGDNVKVRFSTETDFAAAQMKLDGKTGRVVGGTIYLNPQGVQRWKDRFGLPTMNEAYRSMMLHEIQHVIQGIDNLPSGSSEDWFKEIVKKAPVIRKEINSLDSQIQRLPDGVPLKQQKIDRRDALQRHIDFMEANKGKHEHLKYVTTQGEMDAQWVQANRDVQGVKYRHPIQEDRGATYMDEGTRQVKFQEENVALTSPAFGVTGSRPDTRPMEFLSPSERKAAAKEPSWTQSQDFSELLSDVKPSANVVPYNKMNGLERRLVQEHPGDARIKGVITRLRELEDAGLITERERYQKLNELTQPVEGEWR